jgi:hypothetical protein
MFIRPMPGRDAQTHPTLAGGLLPAASFGQHSVILEDPELGPPSRCRPAQGDAVK